MKHFLALAGLLLTACDPASKLCAAESTSGLRTPTSCTAFSESIASSTGEGAALRIRVLSATSCERWLGFTNERKSTSSATCMGGACDSMNEMGSATGLVKAIAPMPWSSEQDETVRFAGVDARSANGASDTSAGRWDFAARRVDWLAGAGDAQQPFAVRALWCDACRFTQPADPSCTAPAWPDCVATLCSK